MEQKTPNGKISLIVVREKEKWTNISKVMSERGIQYSKARNVKSGN